MSISLNNISSPQVVASRQKAIPAESATPKAESLQVSTRSEPLAMPGTATLQAYHAISFGGKVVNGMDLKPGANLEKANLAGTDLSNLDLHGVTLKGADLKGVNLENANLEGANLSHAQMEGANLDQANLTKAILSGASLPGASFLEADLSNAQMGHTYLNGANFSNANLSNAFVGNSEAAGACFEEANLQGANLMRAELRGADLSYADMSGTCLYNAHDLDKTSLNGAKYIWNPSTPKDSDFPQEFDSHNTHFPKGFNVEDPAHEMVNVYDSSIPNLTGVFTYKKL